MSNQPAEDLPQGWSMVFSNEDTMEMEMQPLAFGVEMLAQVLEMAWQMEQRAALREAEEWKRKTAAEVGRRLAKDLAGLKK
ncbi:hypothetical protein TgHK011_007090 [Trichoderma gracile]|nr:hypothetical protein TgHK011_007090 [Trichoderma gracile]